MSDNIILAETLRVIDFGKATMISRPVIYYIAPGSKEQNVYNTNHRHLAHELRNIPGSKQSVLTDTYSIGHTIKHAVGWIKCNPLVQLGRSMKTIKPEIRISLASALEQIRSISVKKGCILFVHLFVCVYIYSPEFHCA